MGMNTMFDLSKIIITPEILRLIAEIDEFKGAWQLLGRLTPEKLHQLRKVATIESIGSSTRIEGSQLSDREVEKLLSNLEYKIINEKSLLLHMPKLSAEIITLLHEHGRRTVRELEIM